MDSKNTISIYCDGGARGNPGPAACAFVVFDNQKQQVYREGRYLGKATNNAAEYEGVLLALNYLKNNETRRSRASAREMKQFNNLEIHIFLDSLLVVSQINGLFKVKDNNLRNYLMKIRLLVSEIHHTVLFSHVSREHNKDADLLVNLTLDQFI